MAGIEGVAANDAYAYHYRMADTKARLLKGLDITKIKQWDDEFLEISTEKGPSKAAAWLQNHPSKEYQNYYRALIGLKKDEPFTEESIQRPFDDSVIW